ncbi:DUF1634 domain-containing protein [Pleurocapsales cyanobacterium LEGE 06147]|nr:DUF1634 domain-containing protein [Pleurocapsales cyanobacterium LEGE 06147]
MNFFNLRAKVSWSEEVRDSSRVIEQSVDTVGKFSNSQIAGKTNLTSSSYESTLKRFVSSLLKYGVLLASTIVFVGGILYLIICGTEPANYQFFREEPSELCSPVGVITAALSGNPLGIIQLGLFLLIATPVLRVALSFLIFLWQRDLLYGIVTLFVLSELIYSFIGAYF